jgi:hypothetical protein
LPKELQGTNSSLSPVCTAAKLFLPTFWPRNHPVRKDPALAASR